ncbi:hypothetical protein ZIOFF_069306 [Zingiber officinale]|uniref:Uncharacterized protein n=1 Tax=Zingiber officinale TaxID=94328 RepID=A0A8J5EV26_ZINOF|nr:hypothetical protein ZIOFF_069306 [Zingiber officinale]
MQVSYCKVYIQSTCATSGEGLYEGLDWLSSNIASKVSTFSFLQYEIHDLLLRQTNSSRPESWRLSFAFPLPLPSRCPNLCFAAQSSHRPPTLCLADAVTLAGEIPVADPPLCPSTTVVPLPSLSLFVSCDRTIKGSQRRSRRRCIPSTRCQCRALSPSTSSSSLCFNRTVPLTFVLAVSLTPFPASIWFSGCHEMAPSGH